jgi:hypothetical protein
MSIRRALIGGLSILLLIATGLVVVLAARQIRSSVVREAQARVDQGLTTLAALYERELRVSAERLDFLLGNLDSSCEGDESRKLIAQPGIAWGSPS